MAEEMRSRVKKFTIFAFYLVAAGWLALSAAAQDVITTVVGGGPNGLPGVNANLYNPYQVAVDAAGNIYVAAAAQNRVFKISTSGTITVVAGVGEFATYSGDGGQATQAYLNNPEGVAVDTATPLPNVYIADTNNCLVRKVDQNTGVITTIAGFVNKPTGGSPYPSCGYSGNGSAADAAYLNGPTNVAVNPTTSDVYVTDFNNGVVRKIAGGTATGTISLVAGSGGSTTAGNNCQGSTPFGNGGAATSAYLCYPQGIAVDTSTSTTKPNIFISENNGNRCDVREVVGASGDIFGVAGDPTLGCGFTDNVTATSAQFNDPWQMHVSVSGATSTVQVADYNNARIRQFTLTYSGGVPKPGTITTIGGKGQGGFCNDAGPVLNACMNPVGLAYDSSGNYYIGDYGADRVRKVTKSTSDINTIAGWGANGGTNVSYSDPVGLKGVGGTPSLYYPLAVYADPSSSNVYVGGYQGEAVYLWNSSSNEISDFAGNGVYGFDGDGGAANNAATELAYPIGIAKDSKGNIYIADNNNCAIREVEESNGNITTFAGGTSGDLKGCGYSGDGGPAAAAQFNADNSLAFDGGGNMYVADYNNCAIRKIAAGSTTVSTIAGGSAGVLLGCGYSGDGGPANKAKIYHPQGVSADGAGDVFFADQANNRVREIVAGSGIIQTVAGYYYGGYTGDGPATANAINQPGFTATDGNGNLFFSDTNNQILRWVTPGGTMITFAGTIPGSPIASAGFSGDGGPALSAQLYYPAGISRDGEGNFYLADEYNQRVRKITPFAGYGLSVSGLSFETQPTGSTSDFQPVLVSAIGPITFSSVAVSGAYKEIDDCAGVSLVAGQTCEIDVYFAPTAPGKDAGTLTIGSNAKFALNPSTVALTGTGGGLTLTGSLAFPAELLGSKTTQTATLTTGAALTIKSIAFSTTGNFSITGGSCPVGGGTLAAGGSCTIDVTFEPETEGFKKDTLVINSNDPASPLLASATGTGTVVKLSATSLAYGTVPDRNTVTDNITVTNTGTTTLTISTTALSGSGAAQFAVATTAANTCKSAVAAGKTCTLPVIFNPTSVGTFAATLTLTTNGGSNPTVALSGTSEADVTVSSDKIAFATIKHATNETSDLTITNLGTEALSIATAFSGSGAAEFSINGTGNTCGDSLAGGKTCTLPVKFAPAAADAYTATLTITTNGGANPTVALSGTGD
jgi:hypothetical protein